MAPTTAIAAIGQRTRAYVRLVKQAAIAWSDDRAPSMGAALAFYSAFSLAPLLVIVIGIAGAVFGDDAARGVVVAELAGLVGDSAAGAIQALLKATQESTKGTLATLIGVGTLLVGATTVLVELKDDLDLIWKVPRREGSGLWWILRARFLSLGMILGIGFLLLVSLVLAGLLAAFGGTWVAYFPRAALLALRICNDVFSLAVITLLVAMLFKWLPSIRIAWKDVWIGALITALLLSAGQIAIGLYLGRTAMASVYGAAGAMVVLLLWLYYSAQVFLLGAEFTYVYANRHAVPEAVGKHDGDHR
jgi:membrane protein